MRSNYKKLGEYIRPVDERNSDLAISNLLGVSITKEFIPSIANIIGTDLSTYKIVRRGQFAYGPVTSRNGDKVSIALLEGEDCIISSSYFPFEVYKPNELFPEYLKLWFIRPEFDRYARFMSNGSAREIFDWDCMCDVELPVPPIGEQRKIVRIYNVVTDRIKLLQKINRNLEEQLLAIFTDHFSNSIANISNDSCPKLGDLVTVIDNRGKTPPLTTETFDYPIIDVGALKGMSRIVDFNNCTKYVDQLTYETWFRSGHPKPWDIIISTVGSLAEMKVFLGNKGCMAQNVVAFRATGIAPLYLYQYLRFIRADLVAYDIGSVQPSIKVTHIIKHPIFIPEQKELNDFENVAKSFTNQIYAYSKEYETLVALRDTLLPRLMSGKLDVSSLEI